MSEFHCRVSKDGGLDFGERDRAYFKSFLAKNAGVLLQITAMFPESKKQRNFLEGAVIPLITFYQEGYDHTKWEDVRKVREWLKVEFNGEMIIVDGKQNKVAKSTAGRAAMQSFLERITEWLMENYSPPAEALEPKRYKIWRDTIMPYGGADNYIDHLRELKIL